MAERYKRRYPFFERRLVISCTYFFIIFLKSYSFSVINYIENSKVFENEKIIEIIKLEGSEDINPNLIKIETDKRIKDNVLIQNFTKVKEDNKFFIKIKIEYIFKKSGIQKIPSLNIIYKNKTYKTIEQEVKIFKKDETDIEFPINVYWDFDKKEIYEYESVGIVLRVNWLTNSNIYTNITPVIGAKHVIIEKIPIFEDIKYKAFNNKEILDLPIYNFILTPLKGAKEIDISEFNVYLDKKIKRVSERIGLKIKPLPEEVRSLAVGDFKISYESPSSELINQDIFTIIVKISGVGNLPYLFFPEIETYNANIIYKKKNYNFNPTKDGYKGSISKIYTLKPENKGPIFINVKDFVYFNPINSKVYYIKGFSLKHKYLGLAKNSISKETKNLNHSEISLLDYYEILGLKNKTFLFLISYFYLILIPGFLFSLVFLLKYRKFFTALGVGVLILILTIVVSINAVSDNSFSKFSIESIISKYNNKNYKASLNSLDNILKKNPNYAGLWSNRAVILSKMERDFEAIYSAYKSLNIVPNNLASYKVIDYLEYKNGINENIKNNSFIFSNIFFIISLVLVNLFIIVISCRFFSNTLKKITVITLFFLILFSCFNTYYFYCKQKLEIGIIKGDLVSLYKVPDNFSRSWRFLKGNLSVYILDIKDDFVLIETSYGLKGWISKNFILSIKESIF